MYFSSRTVHRAEREDEVANSAGHPFNPREQADEAGFANV